MSNCNLALPTIFVIGLQGKTGKNLIDGIIGNQILKAEVSNNYTWFIDNKYYTSTVSFYDVKDINDLSSTALNAGEAILIYIDPSKGSVFEEIELILHTLAGQCELDKQILVVDEFEYIERDEHLSGLTKLEVLTWCIDHGFELEELCSDDREGYEEDEKDEDSVDRSLMGLVRLTQSLQANCWSNLILKDKVDHTITMQQAGNISLDANGDENVERVEAENLSDSGAADVDNFNALLSTLGDMKITANSLPDDERKAYAEKMAISFWQSLGGDEEEIRDSNSDSEY